MANHLLLEFSDDHPEVELWSRDRLPFEPKGALRDLRETLAGAIRALPPAPRGALLHATYASPVRDRCDAENILFYNVGPGAFAAVARYGARFERGYVVPPPAALHYHRYRFASQTGEFTSWRRGENIASWGPVRVDRTANLVKAGWVWQAVKRTITQLHPLEREAPFGVSVSISGAGRLVNAASLLKPLIDGVVAAFQCQTESGDLPEICRRVGFQLSMEPQEVRALLTNAAQGVLGTHRMVCLRAGGVQWSPADDRCVAGELLVKAASSGSGCWLSGTVFPGAPIYGGVGVAAATATQPSSGSRVTGVEGGCGTAVVQFTDDDANYLQWVNSNPSGFVVNCYRRPTAVYLKLHRATCSWLRGKPANGNVWTRDYAKVCSLERRALERWARDIVNGNLTPCGRCSP